VPTASNNKASTRSIATNAGKSYETNCANQIQAGVDLAIQPLIASVQDLPEDLDGKLAFIQPNFEAMLAAQAATATDINQIKGLAQTIVFQLDADSKPGEIDEACIQDAFFFVRALNQIEDLVVNQKFEESNSTRLQGYRDNTTANGMGNRLYRGCIEILEDRTEQLSEELATALIAEFNALYDSLDSALDARFERAVAMEQFRKRIWRFFLSGQCHSQVEDDPVVQVSIA
jgi:hypothetical protein